MKIAFIYDAAYPWVKGGAEKRIYEIGKMLAKNGHEVHWYSVGFWRDNQPKNINYHGINMHGVCKPIEFYTEGKRSIRQVLYFSINLVPEIIKENFDIIDCQEFPYFPCFIAKLHSIIYGSKLVITWIEVWENYWYEYLGTLGFIGKYIELLVSRLTRNNIAISKKTKDDLLSISNLKEDNIPIIPIGIDSVKKIEKNNFNSDIIFAGRLIKHKNVDILIKAIDILKDKYKKDLKCVIIGDGPENHALKDLVCKMHLKDNIIFTGSLENHDEVISYMKSSKVFVLPSTREGLGIVVIEANACGLPVVVIKHKDNAACNLIENYKNGLISEFSKENIAESIIRCLEDKNMRKSCITYSEEYKWESLMEHIEKYYANVLK